MSGPPKIIKILVAPLDWGLGHTTRCIPLIHHLQQKGFEVIAAGNAAQQLLLRQEFPDLMMLDLEGYNISYTSYKRLLAVKILLQIPSISKSVERENRWLQKIINTHKISLVISDNRYGLHTNNIPCVFITHQLLIKAPFLWVERLFQNMNYTHINRFTVCWVPDYKGETNLAGQLSHPQRLPRIPVEYLGPLSRFPAIAASTFTYQFAVILSGPEPQRSLLEEKILLVAEKMPGNWLVVRGKPGATDIPAAAEHITIHNHLSTSDLDHVLAETAFVISRCGYTTVMEMLALKKKCFLIPTPGQTEQEYLAPHLMQQGWCYSCNQEDDLWDHLQHAIAFNYRLPHFPADDFRPVVDQFLQENGLLPVSNGA